MSFQLLCKSIEARTARELALAKSLEQRVLILTSALYEYGHSVLGGLDALFNEAPAGSSLVRQAQTAATELLSVRYHVDFSRNVIEWNSR